MILRGKRRLLSSFFIRSGLYRPLRAILDRLERPLRVITYHRICDEDAHPFDPGLISVTPEGFERQLRFLAREYDPTTFGELKRWLEQGESLPKRPVVITFDDGYQDCYTVAYPLLRQYGLKACFFVSSDYVQRPRPYWYDMLYLIQQQAKQGRSQAEEALQSLGLDREEEARKILDHLRYGPGSRLLEAIPLIEEGFEDLCSGRDLSHHISIDREKVAEMAANGMEIGSHGRRHLCMSRLDEEELAEEVRGSKEDLEKITGCRVDAFAYPFGGLNSHNELTDAACKRAGYLWVLGNRSGTGACHPTATARGRLSIDTAINDDYFRALLAIPSLFAIH